MWKHKKSGGLYEIIEYSARDSESPDYLWVVYRSVKDGTVWVRPYVEFFDGRFEEVE